MASQTAARLDGIMSAHIKKACAGIKEWLEILQFIGRNYKYSFENQLAIMSQRPDAAAVATFDFWNSIGRRINYGERAIRSYDKEHRVVARLFDVSQTNGDDEYFRSLLWHYEPNKHSGLLKQAFQITAPEPLNVNHLVSVGAERLTDERLSEISEDANANIAIMQLAIASAAYAAASRLGLNLELAGEGSNYWKNYGKINDAKIMGKILAAASEICGEILKTAERGIRNEYRKEQANRREISGASAGEDRGRHNIYVRPSAGRDAVLRPAVRAGAGRGISTAPLRPAAEKLSGGKSASEQISFADVAAVPRLSEESGRGNAGKQARFYEQSEGKISEGNAKPAKDLRGESALQSDDRAAGGGNDTQSDVGNLSAADDGEGSRGNDTGHAGEKRANGGNDGGIGGKDTLILTDEEWNKILERESGSGFRKNCFFEQFIKNEPAKNNIEFLKREYGISGHSMDFDGKSGFISYDKSGCTIKLDGKKLTASWNKIEKRLKALVFSGRYLPDREIPQQIKIPYQPTLEDILNGWEGEPAPGGTNTSDDEGKTGKSENSEETTLEQMIRGEDEEKSSPSFSSDLPADFTDLSADDFSFGGAKTRFADNIRAIKTLNEIESENRAATRAEQEILSKYIGWGGLSQAFDEHNENWKNEYSELKALLSEEEYKSARASSTTAFYTPNFVVKAIYKTLEGFGFDGGRILDPSMGTGRFFTSMPPEMRKKSQLSGIEADSVSGRIGRMLTPSADVRIEGFEKVNLPDGYFDVSITNVPFGDIRVDDARYNRNNFLIHDYFFAKAIDKVRSGGIIAFITSQGTLDKAGESVRKYIFERCDLIGAVRLPNTAFKSANTEATSDIIFLKKRETPNLEVSKYIGLMKLPNEIAVNAYFAENPKMLLGEMTQEIGMYGAVRPALKPDCEAEELPARLDDALRRMTASYEAPDQDEQQTEAGQILADGSVENFSFGIVNGRVYYCENGLMTPRKLSARETERMTSLCEMRDTLKKLLDMQITDAPDEAVEQERGRLNYLYDTFAAKFGNLRARENQRAFSEDSAFATLSALEESGNDGTIKKAAIFTTRTARPAVAVTNAETAEDALIVCVNQLGRVDFGYMQKLYAKSEEEIQNELRGKIFLEPKSRKWQTEDEYLSGDVRSKLETAKIFAESDSKFEENIAALEKSLPKWIEAGDIFATLGTPWIDIGYYRQFTYELLNTPFWKREQEERSGNGNRISFTFNNYLSRYTIYNKTSDKSVAATQVYGTERINAYEIIEQSLNMQDVVIKDPVEYVTAKGNDSVKYVVNAKETAIAREKQEKIRQAFKDWIFKDSERREILVAKYNRLFNCVRERKYNGENLKIPNMSENITLRPHQKNAIARLRSGNNTLLDHVVGSGKTYTMIAGAEEQLRLGLASKVLFDVPNHLTEQFGSDIFRLFPNAKALIAKKRDFEKENRRRFLSRIALSDANMIVIGHSQFEKLSMSDEYRIEQIQKGIGQISSVIEQIKADNGGRYSVKQFEKMKANLEVKIEKLNSNDKKDKMLNFEQLGINNLFVDEAHYYKDCAVYSKMRNVAGISNARSMKSSDMLMKCRYLNETGGIVTFATETPISNSITGMYIMQRYLQERELHKRGLFHFDQWAATFGEQTTALELAPEGSGYRLRTRFAKFHNLPELMQMYLQFADVQTADMLKLPIPKIEGGKPTVVACEPSDELEMFMEEAIERVKRIRNREIPPNVDNMLKFTTDAKKAGLDMRLINPAYLRDEKGKISVCAEDIYEHYIKSAEGKGTQMVFCDTSTPRQNGLRSASLDDNRPTSAHSGVLPLPKKSDDFAGTLNDQFNIYDDLKMLLLDKGIPEAEIAFIHSAKSESDKEELFSKVRSGAVRVLVGSTQKMGAGTNVQQRLVALHHLDCPYRPSDIEQREGRILRQGNENEFVSIRRYVTKRSFDAYLWNIVETKQKFIVQFRRGLITERSCEDIDEAMLSYAEAQAIASGDPRIKEKIEIDADISRLQMLKSRHQNEQYRFEDGIKNIYPKLIEANNKAIAEIAADIETLDKNKSEEFQIRIGERWYDNREKAGEKIIARLWLLEAGEEKEIGEYCGFKIVAVRQSFFEQEIIITGAHRYISEVNPDAALGTIARLENAVRAIPQESEKIKAELAENQKSLETAKQSYGLPFSGEEELIEKLKRQAELNAELSLNEKDIVIADETETEEKTEEKTDKLKEEWEEEM